VQGPQRNRHPTLMQKKKKQAEKGESAIRGPMNEVLDRVMTLDFGSKVES